VLTAHPTQVMRRTILSKNNKVRLPPPPVLRMATAASSPALPPPQIAEALERRDFQHLSLADKEEVLASLRREARFLLHPSGERGGSISARRSEGLGSQTRFAARSPPPMRRPWAGSP